MSSDFLRVVRAWYTVFLCALVGCGASACFPQFSMTVYPFSEASGLPIDLLLLGESVKSGAIVLAMIISGWVYKKLSYRMTFILALLAVVVPQFIMPSIHSRFLFFALKGIQGMGALSFPLFLVLIMGWVPREHTGLSTAVFNGIFYGGGGIGGTLAGFIIFKSGWQASYYITGLLMLGLGLLWLLTIRERREPGSSGEDRTPEVLVESLQPEPAAEKKFWKDYRIWLLALALLGTTWSVQAVTVDMPLFGAFLGYDELTVGGVLGWVTLGMILSCVLSGRVSDFFAGKSKNRGQARLLVMFGGYLLALVSLFLLILTDTTRLALFTLSAFLFTFGSAWGLGVFYSVLPEIYPKEKVPLVTGITGGIGDIGMPSAPFFVGALFGIRGLWRTGWLMCAIVIFASMAAIIFLWWIDVRRNKKNAVTIKT